MTEILIRLLEAVGILAAGWLAFRLVNATVLARASSAAGSDRNQALVRPGRPAILYFTTPDCVTCKTFQRPQLRQLETRLGERIQVVEIDAQAQPDLAGRWGVLSVPTTFVLDMDGKPRHVNHGATSAEKLARQVQSLL